MYPNIESACRGLLGEACEITNSTGLQYVVCGGWSPFLRNSGVIKHPGTKDVDLLFSDGIKIGGLRTVIERFLARGFLPSAKHEFQLIRVYEVARQNCAFNVDLLHPSESFENPQMFIDHIELAVPTDIAEKSFVKGKSIVLPASQFIFSGYVENERVECERPSGEISVVDVPLINEVALLVTKSGSCSKAKRPRDLFDIYLAIKQPRNAEAMMQHFKQLQLEHPGPFASLRAIQEFVSRGRFPQEIASIFKESSLEVEKASDEIRAFITNLR